MVVGTHLGMPTRDRSRDTCPSIYNREKSDLFQVFSGIYSGIHAKALQQSAIGAAENQRVKKSC